MSWRGGFCVYSAVTIGAEMIHVHPLEAYGRAAHVLGIIKADTSAVFALGQARFSALEPSQCLSEAGLLLVPFYR